MNNNNLKSLKMAQELYEKGDTTFNLVNILMRLAVIMKQLLRGMY